MLAVLDVPRELERGKDSHDSKIIVVLFDGAALDRELSLTPRDAPRPHRVRTTSRRPSTHRQGPPGSGTSPVARLRRSSKRLLIRDRRARPTARGLLAS